MSASLSESHPMLIYMLLVLENLADIFRLCQWLIIFAVKKKKKKKVWIWLISTSMNLNCELFQTMLRKFPFFCSSSSKRYGSVLLGVSTIIWGQWERKREREKKKERKKEDEGQTVPVWDLGFLAVTLSTSLSWQKSFRAVWESC